MCVRVCGGVCVFVLVKPIQKDHKGIKEVLGHVAHRERLSKMVL